MASTENKKRSLFKRVAIGGPVFLAKESFHALNFQRSMGMLKRLKERWVYSAPSPEAIDKMAEPLSQSGKIFTGFLILAAFLAGTVYTLYGISLMLESGNTGGWMRVAVGVVMMLFFGMTSRRITERNHQAVSFVCMAHSVICTIVVGTARMKT